MKRMSKQNHTVCIHARRFLYLCFALILAQFFVITLQLFLADGSSTYLYSLQLYRGMLEYIMLDITIAVVGAFLMDLTSSEFK